MLFQKGYTSTMKQKFRMTHISLKYIVAICPLHGIVSGEVIYLLQQKKFQTNNDIIVGLNILISIDPWYGLPLDIFFYNAIEKLKLDMKIIQKISSSVWSHDKSEKL